MYGARSRQLSLSKIVPYDFVEPTRSHGLSLTRNKNGPTGGPFLFLAERVGFEPTDVLRHRLISSQVHSTTLPPLREGRAFYTSISVGRSSVYQPQLDSGIRAQVSDRTRAPSGTAD